MPVWRNRPRENSAGQSHWAIWKFTTAHRHQAVTKSASQYARSRIKRPRIPHALSQVQRQRHLYPANAMLPTTPIPDQNRIAERAKTGRPNAAEQQFWTPLHDAAKSASESCARSVDSVSSSRRPTRDTAARKIDSGAISRGRCSRKPLRDA
jgi:hypothetical protein